LQNFDGLHVWDKAGLSGYLVSLLQPNKPDRPNRPNEQDRLTAFFSILLESLKRIAVILNVSFGLCLVRSDGDY